MRPVLAVKSELARSIRILAIAFPALGTAVVAIIAFYCSLLEVVNYEPFLGANTQNEYQRLSAMPIDMPRARFLAAEPGMSRKPRRS